MSDNEFEVTITYLDKIGTLVIKKAEGSGFFLASDNSIVITKSALLLLLKQLISSDIIHPKSFYGLLEELNTD